MPVLPESSSFNDFGGSKVDYSPVVDTSTDRSAQQLNDALCDVAQMSRTAIRGWVRITLSPMNNPTLVSSNSWNTVWRGGTSTSPTFIRSGTGVNTITFPASVNDEQGNAHTINIQSAQIELEGGNFGFCSTSVTSANVITIYTANTSGSASDFSCVACIWFN